MVLPLTSREIALIMGWRRDSFWPDEERVLRKLQRALDAGTPPTLSRLQVQMLQGWGEEQVGGHYGSAVANPEERAVMSKLRVALEENP